MHRAALPSALPLVALIILGIAITAGVAMSAGGGNPAAGPRGLDLPVGFEPRASVPETEERGSAELFGVPMSSAAIHLCYSTYSSLNQDHDPMALRIRGEVVDLIEAVPEETSLSITTYDCYTLTLPTAVMQDSFREAALGWVFAQETMHVQHFCGAALQSITHANTLGLAGQRIVIIARGEAVTAEFAVVTAANSAPWPIDVFYLQPESGPDSFGEWQTFAAANGGTCTAVPPVEP